MRSLVEWQLLLDESRALCDKVPSVSFTYHEVLAHLTSGPGLLNLKVALLRGGYVREASGEMIEIWMPETHWRIFPKAKVAERFRTHRLRQPILGFESFFPGAGRLKAEGTVTGLTIKGERLLRIPIAQTIGEGYMQDALLLDAETLIPAGYETVSQMFGEPMFRYRYSSVNLGAILRPLHFMWTPPRRWRIFQDRRQRANN